MANDVLAALKSLLADNLDNETYDAAIGLLDQVVSNPAAPTTDRRLTHDSFAWVMRHDRRNHVEREKRRQASAPAAMAMDQKEPDTMKLDLDVKISSRDIVRKVQRYE